MAKKNSTAAKNPMLFNSVLMINTDNVVCLVNSLPKTRMKEEEFNAFMEDNFYFGGKYHGLDFNKGSHYSTVVRQLGLYHIYNNEYIPRFYSNIDKQIADSFLKYWLKLYVAPNPTSQPSLRKSVTVPKYVLKEIIQFIENNKNTTNIYEIVDEIYGQALSRNDKGNLPSIIKKYSDCITIDDNNNASLKPNYKQVMADINNLINDPNRYFEHFGKGIASPSLSIGKGYLQQIYYGTPGSGKSHKVKEYLESVYPDEKEREAFVFRTTFHPDSDYASFVGCYKPKMDGDNIKYEFKPQAFTEAYVKAWQETEKQVHLVIEEINRGNCAQIFGDLFQLLDRKGGVSEYPINADADLKQYLEKELGADNEGIANGKLKLPANLNILATMNTSDQSLFPMDSAFKRRWSWECVPIDYTNAVSGNFTITIDGKPYNWHKFLKAVNEKIVSAIDSEDKQMGNFFINGDVDERQFVDKVMFYLWNDICKEEFHTKNNFFRNYVDDKKTEKEFSFNELFGPNATALLKGFMEFLEVSPNVEESQNVEEEIATDSESA